MSGERVEGLSDLYKNIMSDPVSAKSLKTQILDKHASYTLLVTNGNNIIARINHMFAQNNLSEKEIIDFTEEKRYLEKSIVDSNVMLEKFNMILNHITNTFGPDF